MGLEEGRKDQGLHSHELDEDVQGWAGGVLERVTNSVTDDSGLVRVGALASQGAGVLGGLSLLGTDHGMIRTFADSHPSLYFLQVLDIASFQPSSSDLNSGNLDS